MPESRPQTYRDVDVPDNFPEWDKPAQINYLQTAMDREQLANHVREVYGLETRDKPLFKKDELAQIAVEVNHE
jgi:hypothetical protein